MKEFETWNETSTRQAIDSAALYREFIRVKRKQTDKQDSEPSARLKSLKGALDEAQRLNKALAIGNTSSKMVGLLNDWELAGEVRLVFGFEALHAYAALAGVRIKKSPRTIFNWHEHEQTVRLFQNAVGSGAMQLTTTDQVVFSRAGRMGIMRVLGPLSFLRFKKWMSSQPELSTRQKEQDQQQVSAVEMLIAADLLSSTLDSYS